jgi:hypothetical protein
MGILRAVAATVLVFARALALAAVDDAWREYAASPERFRDTHVGTVSQFSDIGNLSTTARNFHVLLQRSS